MSLFSQGWHLAEDGHRIVLRFDVKPKKDLRDKVRACGFRPDDSYMTWTRKLNHDGQCAARYLERSLRGEV